DEPQSVAAKNVIVQALAAAGFDPQPVEATGATIGPDFLSNPRAPVNVRSSGWCPDWPSGEGWIARTFRSTETPVLGGQNNKGNVAFFSLTAVDDRIDAIERLLLTEQAPAWNALDRFVQTRYFPVV